MLSPTVGHVRFACIERRSIFLPGTQTFVGIGLDCQQQANNNGLTLAANFQMEGTTRIKMIDEILIFTAETVRPLYIVEHSFDLF